MKIISSKVMIVTLILISVSSIVICYMKENNSVESKVSLELANNFELTLHISLLNHGIFPLLIHSGVLPWRTQSFLQWVIVPFIYRTPYKILYKNIIKPRLFIDDPEFDIDVLFPNETLEGYISLNDFFPTLHKLVKEENVLVCWSYPLFQVGFSHPKWYQGYLVIPKLRSKFYKDATWENIFTKKCSTTLM